MAPQRWLTLGAIAISGICIVGCSTSDFVPVTGIVTFDGGPPPHAGRLYFISIETGGNFPARDGSAPFTTSGQFEAVTAKERGLLPGKYAVKVECNKHTPDYSKQDPFGDATVVDPSYTPQIITVDQGKPLQNLSIDVPMKK